MDVQAQNAGIRLFAEKKLTLSSACDISFAGKKRITLIGGGSYLRLEAGKVEYGTTATCMRRVKRDFLFLEAFWPGFYLKPEVDKWLRTPNGYSTDQRVEDYKHVMINRERRGL